jgi:F0F1-type ATP synthase membrane subunit b/b'
MGEQTKVSETASVDRAINQVLTAEREAREAVEQCRARAAQVVAEAEDRARAVAKRTERRIKQAHRIADMAVERALKELLGKAPRAVVGASRSPGAKGSDRAVAVLADEIIDPAP